MYWISKEWVILLCRIWPTLVFLILQKIVFWFWRKIVFRFWRKSFYDFFRDFFPILKKIVFWFIRKSFLIFSRFYFDFEENRFLIFSWFLEKRFIKLICIRINTEKIVSKSRDFNTILSTIYSTIFFVLDIIKSSSPKCYMTFWDKIIYSGTLRWSDISLKSNLGTECGLITDFDVITLFGKVSTEHVQRVRLANRGRLLLWTPSPVLWGTCICSNGDIIHSLFCHVYRHFEFRTSLDTSFLLCRKDNG